MLWPLAALVAVVAVAWWLVRRKPRPRLDAPELAMLRQLVEGANEASRDMVRFRWHVRTLTGDERARAEETLEQGMRERRKAEAQVERLRAFLETRGFDVSSLRFPTLEAAEDAALLEDAGREVERELGRQTLT